VAGDLSDHRRRDGLRWPEQAGCPAYPSFAATEGPTAHAARTGAPALSNDASRDPRYLANQDDTELVPILGRRAAAGSEGTQP